MLTINNVEATAKDIVTTLIEREDVCKAGPLATANLVQEIISKHCTNWGSEHYTSVQVRAIYYMLPVPVASYIQAVRQQVKTLQDHVNDISRKLPLTNYDAEDGKE